MILLKNKGTHHKDAWYNAFLPFSIIPHIIMPLRIMPLSIMPLSIMSLSTMTNLNDIQNNPLSIMT
jgi:hypothetical protein